MERKGKCYFVCWAQEVVGAGDSAFPVDCIFAPKCTKKDDECLRLAQGKTKGEVIQGLVDSARNMERLECKFLDNFGTPTPDP